MKPHLSIFLLTPFLLIIIWIELCNWHRRVPNFTDDNCIRAIVGEYARNDLYGMKLIAHAIRNRNTLKGVYGFHAAHIKKEPKEIWITATLAWQESLLEKDPLNGASEWRSREDISKHGQPEGMYLVKVYNGTYFYKPSN